MQPNYDRQAKLAQSAKLPELEALSQGANPRLVEPFVALGALNARMAQMQSDKLLQGAAAPGSIPSLRDKLQQALQQMKMQAARQQFAQQAQQQAPGMFQVPQGTPVPQDQPEAEDQPVMQARAGGVARLPVDDRMFGYAGGGIIAFSGKDRSDVPRVGEEVPISADERARLQRELEMYLVGEKERADSSGQVSANLKNPRMDVTDLDFTSLPQLEKSDVLQRAMDSIQQKREPQSSTPAPRPAKTLARPIGQEVPLSPEERARLERELSTRVIGERARAGVTDEVSAPTPTSAPTAAPAPATPATPRAPYTGPQQYTLQQQGEDFIKRREAAREANAPARAAAIAQGREDFRSGIANLIAGSGSQGVKDAIPVAASPVSNIPRREAPPPRLPDGRPNPAYAAFIENEAKRDRGADPFAYDQSKLPMPAGGIPTTIKDQKPTVYSGPSSEIKPTNLSDGQKRVNGMTLSQYLEHAQKDNGGPLSAEQREILIRRFKGAEADPVKSAATPGGTKPATGTPTGGAKPAAGNVTAPVADDLEKLAIDLIKGGGYKAKTPESIESIDKAKQEFVAKQPASEESIALLKHYDNMAKRFAANDEEEKAQKARDAYNNLATFLMNTRGSSLGVAAGKANAALQPLLASQETRRQSYQKLRDEQEMLLGKSRYELAAAERARKEGRYDDARKHQLESQKADLEAAKLAEQERGHKLQGVAALMRDKETRRHHEETMARLRSSDAQAAQRHAENMAFKYEKMGSDADMRRQQLMQTHPSYKRITEMLEPLEMVIAGQRAAGKKVDPKLEAQASALRMQKQQIEAQFQISSPASTAPATSGKVIDFSTIK